MYICGSTDASTAMAVLGFDSLCNSINPYHFVAGGVKFERDLTTALIVRLAACLCTESASAKISVGLCT